MLGCALICGVLIGMIYDVMQCLCFGYGANQAPWMDRWIARIDRPYTAKSCLRDRSKARTARAVCKAILQFLVDAFIFLLFAVVISVLLYYTNDGQFRSSAVAMSLIGFGLYRCTIRRLLSPLLLLIRAVLRAGVYWTLTIVTYPVRCVLRWLGACIAPHARRMMLTCRKRWRALAERILTALSHRFKSPKEQQEHTPSPPTLSERIRQNGEMKHGFVSGRKYQ